MSERVGVKEAAEILGVSKKTVYERLRSGKINAEKIDTKHGKKWVINRDELQESAKIENEAIEVRELNELINKDQLMNELIQAINSQNKEFLGEAIGDINETVEKQNKTIQKQNETIQQQNKTLQKINRELSEVKRELQDQKNDSLISKIKNFFK